MHQETKLALKEAILRSLPILQELSGQYQELYLVWNKGSDGGWRTTYQHRTCVGRALIAAEPQLNEVIEAFAGLFTLKHPEYRYLTDPKVVRDESHILKKALGHLWDKRETFACTESDVDALVDEYEEFVDRPTIRIRFQTQLLGYEMGAPSVQLAENLVIRKMNEREISEFQGGSLMSEFTRTVSLSVHEFALVFECECQNAKFGTMLNIMPVQKVAREQFARALLCLLTFKEGQPSHNWVWYRPVKFCPLDVGAYGSLDGGAASGSYTLSDSEVTDLQEHARSIFALKESALETACARLADAQTRSRAQDQILFAVIGMEALLLAGLAKEDRRSELKFRFSLNYSTLFNTSEERFRAFRTAKDLYDHRSAIAHGGNIGTNEIRVGERKLSLGEVAREAKEALRLVIKRFLPHAETSPFKKPGFWEQAYFQLREPKV